MPFSRSSPPLVLPLTFLIPPPPAPLALVGALVLVLVLLPSPTDEEPIEFALVVVAADEDILNSHESTDRTANKKKIDQEKPTPQSRTCY
ncbi:hypothetical protein EJ03DRAFT_327341 [Teratosphaeria nubilosa]|uniref:Secreted protein n=1 Tax=Teratosphaeria nubilosa TaxID=161662 RepID=A0A6G1L981_9PEZI|nr:hypothetical protein EJ03DRAFT_327341 [Teratosphaeria nubilosa]